MRAYKGKKIQEFDFGKYHLLDRVGYIQPFNMNELSNATKRNVQSLIDIGWTFDKLIISPIARIQYTWGPKGLRPGKPEDTKYAHSYLLIGKDDKNLPVVYYRKETESPAAGQTTLYWKDKKTPAVNYIDTIPIEQQIKAAKKHGTLISFNINNINESERPIIKTLQTYGWKFNFIIGNVDRYKVIGTDYKNKPAIFNATDTGIIQLQVDEVGRCNYDWYIKSIPVKVKIDQATKTGDFEKVADLAVDLF